MIWTNKLKTQKCSLDIKMTIKTKVDRLKIINDNLYVYTFRDSIKVYDSKSFKLKTDLKLPFIRKEPLLDILDNEVLIYMAAEKLYFYKINVAEKKFEFMHYLSNICNFLYLSKRKEIFLLTESYCRDEDKPYGMAKADLMGNIILANKITPKINHKFVEPEEINNCGFPTHVVSTTENFSVFHGLLDDKYIINICGYLYDWYDYKIGWGETEVNSTINIYKTDDLKEILEEKHEKYLDYLKIGDNFFKFKEGEIFFFYNDKDNKIEYIYNIFNYLNNITDDELNKEYDYRLYEGYEYQFGYNGEIKKHVEKYFYLSDKLFSFFDDDNNLYIVDISNDNKIVRKIEVNWDTRKYLLKGLLYKETEDKKENLYICLRKKEKQIEMGGKKIEKEEQKIIEEGKIIHGIIGEKKE